MRVQFAFSPLVAVVCLVLSTHFAEAAGAAKSDDIDKTSHTVEVGAVTFSVDAPLHTQYVVTKIAVEFTESADARLFGEPKNIVRLRDAILTTLVDTRPYPIETELDQDALQLRLKQALTHQVPPLNAVKVAILGTRKVPRR